MAKSDSTDPTKDTRSAQHPVQDEWGIYDPERAGLAAVFRKLSTLADHDRDRPAGVRPDHAAGQN